MPFFDAHCHLDQLPHPEESVREAVANGVSRLLAVSEGEASGRKVLDLRARHPGVVLAGLGIHPALAVGMSSDEIESGLRFIEAHLGEADVLGEVGLDFRHAVTEEQRAAQALLLDRMLDMAGRAGKPVNLHSRWAQRQTMETAIRFRSETRLPALMHWFTSSKKLIRVCAEEGLFVSVGPTILSDGPACEVCRHIPDHLLLVETDSPVPFGGKPAAPAWAARVALRLAELRGSDPVRLERLLEENFDRYLTARRGA